MRNIFQKLNFPKSSGGNIYEWQEAKTDFDINDSGVYIIAISASAKNAKQNGTKDDDDLRVALDGYKFGRKEIHEAKTSWKGFGTAAAWDGASLKGGIKTVYFFVTLEKGSHALTFSADGTPELQKIEIFQLDKKDNAIENAIFEFNEFAPGIKTDSGGIPWKSFVFQSTFNTAPFRVKLVDISATCKSSKQKGSTDGDNIKVYANGRIVTNPQAPISKKYQNFFFSGDLSKGVSETLMVGGDEFVFEKNDFSIEIWYDEKPLLEQVKIEILGATQYNQKNTLDRWLSKISEWQDLPDDLDVDLLTARNIVGISKAIAVEYADKHQFFITNESGKKIRLLDDNEVDACRHFCWNVMMAQKFGLEVTAIVTTHHEIFWKSLRNKDDFTRANIMDFWNNFQGREYAKKYPEGDPLKLFYMAKRKGDIIKTIQEVTSEQRTIILELTHKFL